MVRVVKKRTTVRRWLKSVEKVVIEEPEPKIVGRPYISFDVLQDVSMHCDVETARTLGLLCREMSQRMTRKILQPLEAYDSGVTYIQLLTIRKEKDVDEFNFMADEMTVVAPLKKYMRYIWYIHCHSLHMFMPESEIVKFWKPLYKHFKEVCCDMKFRCTDGFSKHEVSMPVLLTVFNNIQKVTEIMVGESEIHFTCDEDPDNRNEKLCIAVEFPDIGGFSADVILSVIREAPLSGKCSVLIFYGFETLRPALAEFGLTQRPVPDGVFTRQTDHDVIFELTSSGTKLHISDSPEIDLNNSYGEYGSDASFSDAEIYFRGRFDDDSYDDTDDDYYNYLEGLL